MKLRPLISHLENLHKVSAVPLPEQNLCMLVSELFKSVSASLGLQIPANP